PLSKDSYPGDFLQAITVEVQVAGRRFLETLPGQDNLSYAFTWDGKDAYGRTVQGAQMATVTIGYVYTPTYGEGIPALPAARLVVSQTWHQSIGGWDAGLEGLGGWSLDVHHAYDPAAGVLTLGDGTTRSAAADFADVISTVAGGGQPSDGLGDNGPA